MKNGLVILALAAVILAFGGMMRIKTDVQTMTRERAKLADQKLQLREEKRVLQAEYANLANPIRLLQLAEKRRYVELDISAFSTMEGHVSATRVVSAAAVVPVSRVDVVSDSIHADALAAFGISGTE